MDLYGLVVYVLGVYGLVVYVWTCMVYGYVWCILYGRAAGCSKNTLIGSSCSCLSCRLGPSWAPIDSSTNGQAGQDVDGQDCIFIIGSVSEGTDFGQKKNLNQQVYWFMV